MQMNFKPYVWVLAVAVGAGIVGGTARAVAFPAMNDQGQGQDYSKNNKYQQGIREGQDDKAHNRDHFRKHHFAKDEDNKSLRGWLPAGPRGR